MNTENCWIRHNPVTQSDPLKWYIEFYDGAITIHLYHTAPDNWFVQGTFLKRTKLNTKNESEAKYAAISMVWNKLNQYATDLKNRLLIEEWNLTL